MDTKVIPLLVISSFLILSKVHGSDLPAGITQCSIGDEKCLKDGMNYVLKNHASTGIKQLGLTQLDPLQIKKFSLGKNPNSPVSVDLTFNNADLLGLKDAQVKRVSAFTRDLSRPITIEMFFPKITLTGPYSVEGKVLILPIVGKGDAKIVLDQCKVQGIVKLKPVYKSEHETYADVEEVKLLLDPGHVSYSLGGLFNNQKPLSDSLHALINENWKEIFNELKGDISRAMGLIFKSVINRTLGKVPIQQLFSDA